MLRQFTRNREQGLAALSALMFILLFSLMAVTYWYGKNISFREQAQADISAALTAAGTKMYVPALLAGQTITDDWKDATDRHFFFSMALNGLSVSNPQVSVIQGPQPRENGTILVADPEHRMTIEEMGSPWVAGSFDIRVQAKFGIASRNGPPVMMMTLDNSGSMGTTEINNAKNAIRSLLDRTPLGSYVGIYTFDRKSVHTRNTVVSVQVMDTAARRAAMKAAVSQVSAIGASTGTYMQGGLYRLYSEAASLENSLVGSVFTQSEWDALPKLALLITDGGASMADHAPFYYSGGRRYTGTMSQYSLRDPAASNNFLCDSTEGHANKAISRARNWFVEDPSQPWGANNRAPTHGYLALAKSIQIADKLREDLGFEVMVACTLQGCRHDRSDSLINNFRRKQKRFALLRLALQLRDFAAPGERGFPAWRGLYPKNDNQPDKTQYTWYYKELQNVTAANPTIKCIFGYPGDASCEGSNPDGFCPIGSVRDRRFFYINSDYSEIEKQLDAAVAVAAGTGVLVP